MNQWFQITGLTGSGKTAILERLEALGAQVLNLEEIAAHKGSVFGANLDTKQPSQSQYEILLKDKIFDFQEGPVFFEAKPDLLGRLVLPKDIKRYIANAQTIYIDAPFESRVQRILNSYGRQNKQVLIKALLKLQNRLDPFCFSKAMHHLNKGELRQCVRELLIYYDNSNGYKKTGQIGFSVPFTNDQQTAEKLYKTIIVQ